MAYFFLSLNYSYLLLFGGKKITQLKQLVTLGTSHTEGVRTEATGSEGVMWEESLSRGEGAGRRSSAPLVCQV